MIATCPKQPKGILHLNLWLSTNIIKFKLIPTSSLPQPVPGLYSSHSHYALLNHRYYHHCPHPPFLESFQHQQLSLLRQSPSSDATRSLHALLTTLGSNPSSLFVNNNLLASYAAGGDLSSARTLFDKMPQRNTISYNSMITAYNRYGDAGEALRLFTEMMSLGMRPTQYTFAGILSSPYCDCYLGFQLQPLVIKMGLLFVDAFSGTALLCLFVRHGYLDFGLKVFEEMPRRSVVTWNSIIGGFAKYGFVEDSVSLFRGLLRTDFCPSKITFLGIISAFQSSDDCEAGEQIHGLVIKSGVNYYAAVTNALVDMYASCSGFGAAERLFSEMPIQDVVSWNTMITAFSKSEKPEKALELFFTMSLNGFSPTQTTFASVIGSCAELRYLDYGILIHAKTIKIGLESDLFVGSALVNLYSKCNRLEDACCCFNEISDRNIVSWNALISGYLMEISHSPVYLLLEMLSSGFRPNEFSFSLFLKYCSVQELQQLHSLIIKMGYEHDEYVSSSVMASYAANGLISDALNFATASAQPLPVVCSNIVARIYNRTGQFQRAKNILSQVQEFDIISWNTLIEACARNGDCREAFELFKCMQTARILPDNCTFMSLLSICAKLCNLGLGSAIHGIIIKIDFSSCDVFVCNVLVDMYAKCGSLESSINVFDETAEKNLISWTVLISALGLHGHAWEALQKFKEMEMVGFKPDRIALIAILSACRHGGLVEEGLRIFEQMKDAYGVEPDMDHYACIVDLLCRNGRMKEAKQVISNIPFQPNTFIWRTFLEGCRRQIDVKI
ncbi:pentatricopeptide repeat-containing protein [Cinnamomum micranthum f. kanehirae]|uniref:Pentatricopeptide repeat-containing protein n=1 Tax=Cinnamomum micranthum f. kanehirae TaxID=337451 RepID=A0A443PET3_9MAGN|nr:pentatricopeptide repeat-containing protein [Cinnamomum micranthum f. kanehirae]